MNASFMNTSINNRSYHSPNSKAIISALYALQDKIRKLESERMTLEQNASFYERENLEIKEERERERLEQRHKERLLHFQYENEHQQREEEIRRRAEEERRKLERDYLSKSQKREEAMMNTLKSEIELLEKELERVKERAHSAEVDKKVAQQILAETVSKEDVAVRSNGSKSKVAYSQEHHSTSHKESKTKNTKKSQTNYNKPPSDIPFLVGKASGKSFHVPSNVQKAISVLKQHSEIQAKNAQKHRLPTKPPSAPCSKVEQVSCATSGVPHDNPVEHIDLDSMPEKERTRSVRDDLGKLLNSLEEEYQLLNKQYRNLLSQSEGLENNPALSSSIQNTVERMNQKAEQIKTLKNFQKKMRNTIIQSPKKSPLVDERQLYSVRMLRNFQDLNGQQ